MKTLKCCCGADITVDDIDFDVINQYSWHCSGRNKVVTSIRENGTDPVVKSISSFIMPAPLGQVVDHVDMNGHNNLRDNLRLASCVENTHNSRKRKDNTSGFKGVSFNASFSHRNKPWQSVLVHNSVKYRSNHKTAEEAALAYDKRAIELYGDFARPNFSESWTKFKQPSQVKQ